jgi:hypothetical protein
MRRSDAPEQCRNRGIIGQIGCLGAEAGMCSGVILVAICMMRNINAHNMETVIKKAGADGLAHATGSARHHSYFCHHCFPIPPDSR